MEAYEKENMHRKIEEDLSEILCWKTERTISKNLEIGYEGKLLQIQEKPTREMQRSKATIIEKLNGEIKIIYRGKELKYRELETRSYQGRIRDKKSLLNQEVA